MSNYSRCESILLTTLQDRACIQKQYHSPQTDRQARTRKTAAINTTTLPPPTHTCRRTGYINRDCTHKNYQESRAANCHHSLPLHTSLPRRIATIHSEELHTKIPNTQKARPDHYHLENKRKITT